MQLEAEKKNQGLIFFFGAHVTKSHETSLWRKGREFHFKRKENHV